MSLAATADASAVDSRFAQPRTLFFGIGAQRSGTTWLHDFLAGHPQVHVPGHQKELHYWTTWRPPYLDTGKEILERQWPTGQAGSLLRAMLKSDGMAARRRRIERGAFLEAWRKALTLEGARHGAYADVLLHGYRGEPVAGEITPAYALLGSQAFAEMAVLAPDVRFIFVMRDPVDRLHAGTRHWLRRGRDPEDLTAAMVAEHMEASLADPADGHYLRSRYDLTIRALESAVAPERIAYFFYETLFSQAEADRLCAFLEVAPRPAATDRRVNAGHDKVQDIVPDLARKTRLALASVYEFCAMKFAELPEAWRGESGVKGG